MSKKFGMRNALCTLMACGATMGGISAVSQSSHPVFAEEAARSGGEFQLMQQNVSRKKAKKTLNRLIESKVMGGSPKEFKTSADAETKGLIRDLYEKTFAAAKKDCIAVSDDPIDTRAKYNPFRYVTNPAPEDVEYALVEDSASVGAVNSNFPEILKIANTCSAASNELSNIGQSMSLAVFSLENFFYSMKKLDMQLKLLPNYVEEADRRVIYDKMITESLETSILGKKLDLDLLSNEKIKAHVQKLFDEMKKSWKERLDAVKKVVDARKDEGTKVSENKKPKGNRPRNNSGKPRNNGKPRK